MPTSEPRGFPLQGALSRAHSAEIALGGWTKGRETGRRTTRWMLFGLPPRALSESPVFGLWSATWIQFEHGFACCLDLHARPYRWINEARIACVAARLLSGVVDEAYRQPDTPKQAVRCPVLRFANQLRRSFAKTGIAGARINWYGACFRWRSRRPGRAQLGATWSRFGAAEPNRRNWPDMSSQR